MLHILHHHHTLRCLQPIMAYYLTTVDLLSSHTELHTGRERPLSYGPDVVFFAQPLCVATGRRQCGVVSALQRTELSTQSLAPWTKLVCLLIVLAPYCRYYLSSLYCTEWRGHYDSAEVAEVQSGPSLRMSVCYFADRDAGYRLKYECIFNTDPVYYTACLK
jgi:hypothetical protein